MTNNNLSPVRSSERYVILDALRGFAILGIALANFPEFSLYTFLPADDAAQLPATGGDRGLRYLLYLLVDGKFYTLFSLLFGIGFSIILSNVTRKGGNALRVFYRRMVLLALIGGLHLIFLWSGDILLLYALLGMLLPLFRHLSDRRLLAAALALLFIPVCIDTVCELTHTNPSARVVELQQIYCARFGITDANFAYWLHDATGYNEVFQFLIQGALVRMQEFIDGNRYFKVLGLFLIGYYIGRQRLYARLEENKPWLKRLFAGGLMVGLPLSLLYAWSSMNAHPWGLSIHSLLYFVSVYPMAFAYASGFGLLYLARPRLKAFTWLAAPGRMALSNYIGQSLAGMFIFYGIGLGLGSTISLATTELIVLVVFVVQQAFSRMWLNTFRFGPLEWIWRMLTYGHWIACRKPRSGVEP